MGLSSTADFCLSRNLYFEGGSASHYCASSRLWRILSTAVVMNQTLSSNAETPVSASEVVKESIPNSAQPIAHLRVLAQQDLEQTDYPIYPGALSVGVYIVFVCLFVCNYSTTSPSLVSQTFRWGWSLRGGRKERLVAHVDIHVVLEFEKVTRFQSLHHVSRACKVVVV